MKITINHVHSGNIEVNLKEEPRVTTKQDKANGEEDESVSHEKKAQQVNFRWMLAGTLAGVGVSFFVSIIDRLVGEIGDLVNGRYEATGYSLLVQSLVYFFIFGICLHSAFLIGYNKTKKLERHLKRIFGGTGILVLIIYVVLLIRIKCQCP